jgi:serine/threonine protein phosphatase PrpC
VSGAAPTTRRRVRLVRGPLTIGEPAVPVAPVLAAGDPYRPDTIADGGTALGMTVRAASVRGLAKRYLGGPRQDDLCLGRHQPTATLIAALADGVSGAPSSGLGAALAVRHAVAAVARQLDAHHAERRAPGWRHGDGSGEADGARTVLDWEAIFRQAAWALVQERRRTEPGADVQAATATLATTLTVAAVVRHQGSGALRAQIAAIGDSPAFALERGRFRKLLDGGACDDGLIGAPVAALPGNLAALVSCACELEPGAVLLLCSDGLALPLADGRGEVGRLLARELARAPDVIDFARLLDFSRATYDDDRTMIAVWADAPSERQGDAAGGPAAEAASERQGDAAGGPAAEAAREPEQIADGAPEALGGTA